LSGVGLRIVDGVDIATQIGVGHDGVIALIKGLDASQSIMGVGQNSIPIGLRQHIAATIIGPIGRLGDTIVILGSFGGSGSKTIISEG